MTKCTIHLKYQFWLLDYLPKVSIELMLIGRKNAKSISAKPEWSTSSRRSRPSRRGRSHQNCPCRTSGRPIWSKTYNRGHSSECITHEITIMKVIVVGHNDDWFTSAFLPGPQSCSYLLQSWTPVQKRIVIFEALLSWYDPNEWYFSNDPFCGFVEFDSSTLKSMEPSPSLSKILNNWSK